MANSQNCHANRQETQQSSGKRLGIHTASPVSPVVVRMDWYSRNLHQANPRPSHETVL